MPLMHCTNRGFTMASRERQGFFAMQQRNIFWISSLVCPIMGRLCLCLPAGRAARAAAFSPFIGGLSMTSFLCRACDFTLFHRAATLVALSLALCVLWASDALAARRGAAPKENLKYAALVMDAETGRILSQSNPDKLLHPASLTKVMTLLLAFDALEEGRMSLRDRIRISPRAAGMEPSKLGIEAGKTIRVEDAIYAVVTKSANDVAVALAEALGGSEPAFARMMTARARRIGMSNTQFVNASGLHNPRQVSTARDMALLARHVILQYPAYYRYFSTKSFQYGGAVLRNHNRLMETYRGMDGMKTGYIAPSGFNLVASAVRNDRRLIGVVFGGRSAASRNARMAELLDQGFAQIGKDHSRPLLVMNTGESAKRFFPVPPRRPESAPASVEPAPRIRETGILVSSVKVESRVGPATRSEALSFPVGALGGTNDTGDFQGLKTPFSGESKDPSLLERASFAPASGSLGTLDRRIARTSPVGAWAIQIGAFGNSTATAKSLRDALGRLPGELTSVRALVSPLKMTSGEMVYRARLSGYDRNDAIRACRHFRECLVIAPRSN